jgi:predicted transcriptional regulator
MGKQKLTECKVVRIKRLLLEGATHTELGKKFGVSRSEISKIYKGMIDPEHKNARWAEVKI